MLWVYFISYRTVMGQFQTPEWAGRVLLDGLRLGLGGEVGAVAALGLGLVGLLSYGRTSRVVAWLAVLPPGRSGRFGRNGGMTDNGRSNPNSSCFRAENSLSARKASTCRLSRFSKEPNRHS